MGHTMCSVRTKPNLQVLLWEASWKTCISDTIPLFNSFFRVETHINIIQICMSEIIITGIAVFEKSDNDFCHIVAVVWHCEKNLLTLG